MKIELSDISGLPEGLKAVVETEGDKSTLDLSKVMPMEDLTGLKNTVVNLRSQVDEWKKLGDVPDAVSKRIADLEDKAAKGGKGGEEAQAKLDALKSEYEGKLTGANDRIAKMMTANAASSLKAELAKAGFIPEAIDDIAATALGRVQFNDDGSPKVLTADGKPMIGSGADHGATLTDLAKELAQSKPYAVRDEGKGGGGKPPQNGGKPSEKTVTRAQWNDMSHSDRAAHSKDGGKVVDA
jgi:hypothetical protein